MDIGCCNNSSFNPFQVSTILCGKLYFFVSFRHRLFLIFLECPLICLVSSSITTRFCLSSFSIPFTVLYRVIRSPHSLLFCRVDNSISFNLSSYVSSLKSGTIFVVSFVVSLYPFLHLVTIPLLHIPTSDVSYWLEFFSSCPYPCSRKPP